MHLISSVCRSAMLPVDVLGMLRLADCSSCICLVRLLDWGTSCLVRSVLSICVCGWCFLYVMQFKHLCSGIAVCTL
jgi:hypothetical protein